MHRRRLITAGAVVLLALSLLAAGAAAVIASKRARPGAPSPARSVAVSCRSSALGASVPTQVYLPAGYGDGSRRYPVIYFLHGLPAGPASYTTNAFVAGALASSPTPAIVAAPQGARAADSDREYLDWGPQENWPLAIARDVTHCVDTRFRTIADRHGRALIGLSAGGYGAFNIGLRNLATFAAVQSWSGYFEATDPSGQHQLDLGSDAANWMARVPRGTRLKARLSRYPTFIAFYVGRQDMRFLADNESFDEALTAEQIRHLFRTYPGGHSGALWRAEASQWLGYALRAMSAGGH